MVVGAIAGVAASCEWPSRTRYVKPVFDEVTITRGIAYRTTTDYLGNLITICSTCTGPTGPHGHEAPGDHVAVRVGAGCSGDRNQLSVFVQDAAERGDVGVTIDYRLRPNQSGTGPPRRRGHRRLQRQPGRHPVAEGQRCDLPHRSRRGRHRRVLGGGDQRHEQHLQPDRPVAGRRGGSRSPAHAFTPPSAGDRPILMFQGTVDTLVSPSSSTATCNATKAKGNVCDYVTYQGGDHFIAFTQGADIRNRTAQWIFEKVLIPLGYSAEQIP